MLKPLRDYVVIEVSEAKESTVSGIVLPDSAKEAPQKGKVIAVGSGHISENGKKEPLEVSTGDTVIFSKYAGTEVKVDEKEYLILKEKDILAIEND